MNRLHNRPLTRRHARAFPSRPKERTPPSFLPELQDVEGGRTDD